MEFGRFSDGSVELAVDLVNTVDLEGDSLRTVADLDAFLRRHGWDKAGLPTPEDLEVVRAARASLREVFEGADAAATAATLNRLVVECGATPRLTDHDGRAWHLHFVATDAPLGERLVGTCAAALMLLYGEDGDDRLGVCGADDCRWVYVDTSKNRSRRYCGETCTTRERVRAHRRRRRAGTS